MVIKLDEMLGNILCDNINIHPVMITSTNRMKELTFDKIHKTQSSYRNKRSRFASLGALAAIISAFLTCAVFAEAIPIVFHKTEVQYEIDDAGNILSKEEPDWGIEFSASNVTPTGMRLSCKQAAAGKLPSVSTGVHYYIEAKTEDGWSAIARLDDSFAWQYVETPIEPHQLYTWDIDWSEIYGVLDPGIYRLRKQVWTGAQPDPTESYEYTVEFEIPGGD